MSLFSKFERDETKLALRVGAYGTTNMDNRNGPLEPEMAADLFDRDPEGMADTGPLLDVCIDLALTVLQLLPV